MNLLGYVKKITSFFCVNKSTLVLIAASNLSPTGNVNNFKGFFFFITVHCVVIFVSKVD